MKNLSSFVRPCPRRGVALVLVITFLVLITGLIIAFLSTVSTETQVSKRADAGNRGRELIDTVNAVVMSQIRDATSQGPEVAWASQPGMIRTYGTAEGKASPAPLRYYKLYSAKDLVWQPEGNKFNPAEDVPPGWADNEAMFTDMNRPVSTLTGEMRYPVFQPPAENPDPAARPPEGISVGTPPVANNGTSNAFVNPAPMPVRWIYVLRDGRLTSPTEAAAGVGQDGAQVSWAEGAADAPTENNPIVGRIAFWTDDETNKININTAAGDVWTSTSEVEAGSYWDIPRVTSQFDRQALANFQPALREYQRYPGHPASTYLSAAFPFLTRADIVKIASRVEGGGSMGGTTMAMDPVGNDADRLYSYVDELVYDNVRGPSVITPAQLAQAHFALTAHSRAPEVNLFNMPRIASWPVHRQDTPEYRSAYDRLIAFCSKVGNRSYIFDRENADSQTADYAGRNVQLYSYLQRSTAATIPGYGGNFLSKYGPDRDQILTEIFDYIRSTNLFDDTLEPQPMTFPTKGKQFTNGRGSANGTNPGHGQVTPIRIGNTRGFGRFLTITEAGVHFIATADYDVPESNVVPRDNLGKPLAEQRPVNITLGNTMTAQKLNEKERRIEAMFVMEAFSPSQGWTALRPDMQIRVKGLETLTVNGRSLGFPAAGVLKIEENGGYHSRKWGGNSGVRFFASRKRLPARGVMPADIGWNETTSYPFVSIPITVSSASGTMAFSGGLITIEIFADTNQNGGQFDPINGQEPVQTLTLRMPAGNFPVPRLVMNGGNGMASTYDVNTTDTNSANTTREYWWTFSANGVFGKDSSFISWWRVGEDTKKGMAGRMEFVQADPGSRTSTKNGGLMYYAAGGADVIRTVLVSHGDYRLLAANPNPPEDIFVPHRYYNNAGQFYAHSLMEATGSNYLAGADDQSGSYVNGANYPSGKKPDIQPSAVQLVERTGDFDTGVAAVHDGPYINKPDEGNQYRKNFSTPYFDHNESQETPGATFFSPNRQIPSPVMFGSLPNRVKADIPWSTLLFRPDTHGGHIGAQSPPDHLLLDLFWMPVVEPYAVSEPLSTAGKINMNYQIVPFTYIQRTTALRALLRSERVLAVPTTAANQYKTSTVNTNYRKNIDANETLKQFQTRFDNGEVFRSPSEICTLFLVPENETLDNMPNFWNQHRLTADNSRERPYASLYPRLTTKSNTYRIHYRVQALQQSSRSRGGDAGAWATWTEGKDQVLAENRGSSVIERYVDPADPALPDYATVPGADTLDNHYRFRVLGTTKFGP